MAVFRIIASRPQRVKSFGDHPEFDIELISGTVSAGFTFRLFEAEHACDFTVLGVREAAGRMTLAVNKPVSWPDEWAGAIVDTDDPEATRRYRHLV